MRKTWICLAFALASLPAIAAAESPRDMLFELKFGFYRPSIDSEFSNGATPYRDIFGGGNLLLTKLEWDYEIFKDLGVIAIGGTIGFGRDSGNGLLRSGEKSKDSNKFYLIPLSFDVIYRFDWLAQKHGIPFVPIIKGGFDYYIWWISNGVGKVPKYTNEDGRSFEGRGGTFGGHVGFGLAFLMDWLAQDMATVFDSDVGVNNTYLFAEYMMSWVDDFGSSRSLDLSSKVIQFGIAFEF